MRVAVWMQTLVECRRLLSLADRVFQDTFSEHALDDLQEFGSLVDCGLIVDACRTLAIVFFCQCLHAGNADPGKIMANSRRFNDPVFARVRAVAFPSTEEISSFETFCEQVLTIRDKAIAHADGSLMAIQEPSPGLIARRSAFFHLRGVDFQYFASVIDDLLRALQSASSGEI